MRLVPLRRGERCSACGSPRPLRSSQEPALREPLSPRSFVELHRSPGKLGAYTEEIERLAIRHRAAIDGVIERYPELAAAAGMESLREATDQEN